MIKLFHSKDGDILVFQDTPNISFVGLISSRLLTIDYQCIVKNKQRPNQYRVENHIGNISRFGSYYDD